MSGEIAFGAPDPRTHRCGCGKAIRPESQRCRRCTGIERRRVRDEMVERAQAMRAAGMKKPEIARALGIEERKVAPMIRGAHGPTRRSRRK